MICVNCGVSEGHGDCPRCNQMIAQQNRRKRESESPTDLEVSQRREKMWRDECTRIVTALADLAGLPRDPCPGWQPCVQKIKDMLANAQPDAPGQKGLT